MTVENANDHAANQPGAAISRIKDPERGVSSSLGYDGAAFIRQIRKQIDDAPSRIGTQQTRQALSVLYLVMINARRCSGPRAFEITSQETEEVLDLCPRVFRQSHA